LKDLHALTDRLQVHGRDCLTQGLEAIFGLGPYSSVLLHFFHLENEPVFLVHPAVPLRMGGL
jgi:hypothetical protein